MNILPWHKWDPKAFLSEWGLQVCALDTVGAWTLALNHMMHRDVGKLSDKEEGWSRLWRVSIERTKQIIAELETYEIADVLRNGNGVVTLVCRRLSHDVQERQNIAARGRKHRKAKQQAEWDASPKDTPQRSCNANVALKMESIDGDGDEDSESDSEPNSEDIRTLDLADAKSAAPEDGDSDTPSQKAESEKETEPPNEHVPHAEPPVPPEATPGQQKGSSPIRDTPRGLCEPNWATSAPVRLSAEEAAPPKGDRDEPALFPLPETPATRNGKITQQDLDRVKNLWNAKAPAALPRVNIIRPTDSGKRIKQLKTRIREQGGVEPFLTELEAVIAKIKESPFLRGQGGRDTWTGATFDWAICPTNWTKILEGNYNRQADMTGGIGAKRGY